VEDGNDDVEICDAKNDDGNIGNQIGIKHMYHDEI
jgi:hypothetical protein